MRAGLGGTEGAATARNCCWLLLQPRMTSERVLMVSVRTSAGIPLAKRMVVSSDNTPLVLIDYKQKGFVRYILTQPINQYLLTCRGDLTRVCG